MRRRLERGCRNVALAALKSSIRSKKLTVLEAEDVVAVLDAVWVADVVMDCVVEVTVVGVVGVVGYLHREPDQEFKLTE